MPIVLAVFVTCPLTILIFLALSLIRSCHSGTAVHLLDDLLFASARNFLSSALIDTDIADFEQTCHPQLGLAAYIQCLDAFSKMIV